MKILMVGGGTGGHIVPLFPLVNEALRRDLEVSFVAGNSDLDRKILEENFPMERISVHFLKSGKIRYYFSWRNFVAPFEILGSFWGALKTLRRERPDVIFFKGGFVCFPILMMAKFFPGFLSKFSGKIFLHESDMSRSRLARFIGRYADRIFSNFPEEGEEPFYLYYGGNIDPSATLPYQEENSNQKGESAHGSISKILVFGGSQGAQFINKLVERNLESLLEKYDVELVTGIGKKISPPLNLPPSRNRQGKTLSVRNFMQHEILAAEVLAEKICEADLVISRASGSIFQILEAKKKSILIPLPSAARDHQTENAQYFSEKNLAKILLEHEATDVTFLSLIEETLADKNLGENLEKLSLRSQEKKILDIILA